MQAIQTTTKSMGQVRPPPRFTGSDQDDLRWFFGEGQSEFARSPLGGMLERAHALSETSTGEQVISLPRYRAKVWEYRQNGCSGRRVGWSSDRSEVPTTLYDAATRDMLRRAAAPFVEEFDPEADAWFSAGYEPGLGRTPSDWAMQRLGRVSRRLLAVSVRHRVILETFHGLDANRWEGHILGREIVLFAMTKAGDLLLLHRSERLGVEDEHTRPSDRIAAEHHRQLCAPDHDRRMLFASAANGASVLRDAANAAYARATA